MSFSGSSEASATPNQLKRKSLVYVDIPPSPLHSSLTNKRGLKKMSKRKGVPQNPLSTRKLNTSENSASSEDIVSIKRRKISSGKSTKTPYVLIEKKGVQKSSSGTNYDPDFPNGYFYCHQCNKKRAKDVELQCTVNENVPCKAKYCKMCLKNRYGEDADQIKGQGITVEFGKSAEHILDAGYIWKCPKCADICNCCRCRKAKGLEPTGNLTNMARKSGTSAADLLAKNPNAKGIIGRKNTAISSNTEISMEVKKKSKQEAPPKKSVKAPNKEKPFKMPVAPVWKEVPTDLSLSQAEDRFFIRESVLRLAPLMNISSKYTEELDEFDYLSDAGVKALILNLLSLIAADTDKDIQQVFKDIMKKISGSGMNLNNLWSHLLEMRQHVPATILNFPDPTPSEIETHRTRTGGNVFQPIQFVPVLVGLAESAIQGASARAEIDNGLRDIKERNKEYFASVRQENERWELIKSKHDDEKTKKDTPKGKNDEKYQELRKEHKGILAELECEHKEKLQAYSPRFKPLGRDHRQRIYYISTTFHSKKDPTLEQINSLEKWSWFLAVWGTSDSDKDVPDVGEDDINNSQEEKWWGFSDPKEIRKLAKWISASADLKQEDKRQSGDSDIEMLDSGASRISSSLSDLTSLSDLSSLTFEERNEDESHIKEKGELIGPATKKEISEVVKGLEEYSEYLSWRIGRISKSRSGGEVDRNGSKDEGEVATKQFYGERG